MEGGREHAVLAVPWRLRGEDRRARLAVAQVEAHGGFGQAQRSAVEVAEDAVEAAADQVLRREREGAQNLRGGGERAAAVVEPVEAHGARPVTRAAGVDGDRLRVPLCGARPRRAGRLP